LKATNVIVILSDEHNKRVTGCYGHPMIKTPNLDKLAARGTRFTSAYTNCPICVPARASFATGQYVHKIRYWDNAIAYDGKVPTWGHRLMERGHRVTSIGKLHYRDGDPRRNGFDEEILPMHIVNGVGDLLGLIRSELPVRQGAKRLGPEAGRGGREALEGVKIASIGPITSATARQQGLTVDVEADPHTVGGMVTAIARSC